MLMSPHPDLGGPLGLRLLGEGFGERGEGGSAGWTAALNRKKESDPGRQQETEKPRGTPRTTSEQDSGWGRVFAGSSPSSQSPPDLWLLTPSWEAATQGADKTQVRMGCPGWDFWTGRSHRLGPPLAFMPHSLLSASALQSTTVLETWLPEPAMALPP